MKNMINISFESTAVVLLGSVTNMVIIDRRYPLETMYITITSGEDEATHIQPWL